MLWLNAPASPPTLSCKCSTSASQKGWKRLQYCDAMGSMVTTGPFAAYENVALVSCSMTYDTKYALQ